MRISVTGRWIVLAGIPLVLPLSAGQSVTGVPEITVCYNYGCKRMPRVTLTPAEWSEVLAVFATAADSAWQERQQVRQAISLMEQFVGRDQVVVDRVTQVRQVNAAKRTMPISAIALASEKLFAGTVDEFAVTS